MTTEKQLNDHLNVVGDAIINMAQGANHNIIKIVSVLSDIVRRRATDTFEGQNRKSGWIRHGE